MGNVVFKRMELLQELVSAADGIGDKVFVTSRPTAMQTSMDSFVVVRLPQSIEDRGATYQDTYCQFVLFAKDRSNGIERADMLEEMQMAVMAKFPLVTKLFSATEPRLLPGGSDELGYHSLIIQAKVTINK